MNDTTLTTISTAIATKLPVLLIGHTGTGKTTIIRELAKTKKKKLVRVSITGDTTVDDLVGKYELSGAASGGTETTWNDGVLTQAVKQGFWLVVDEINMAGGDITAALHSLLDDDAFLTLVQHDSEVVKAHKDFRLFATMNPSHASNYAGTKPNNSAFLSRFGVVIEMNYLDPANEEQLIREKIPAAKKETVACYVSIANDLRQAYHNQQLNYICSTRDILSAVVLTTKGMRPGDAFDVAVAAKAADEREEVLKRAKEHMQAILKLENQLPEKQVSFVTLRDALVKLQEQQRGGIDSKVQELYDQRKKALDADYAQREKEVESLRQQLMADKQKLVQHGYDQCKKELLAKLGAF